LLLDYLESVISYTVAFFEPRRFLDRSRDAWTVGVTKLEGGVHEKPIVMGPTLNGNRLNDFASLLA
jgi:hypothetical protein